MNGGNRMITVFEQINRAIRESKGNVRDALNVALANHDAAAALLEKEQRKSAALLVALEAINTILGIGFSSETTIRAIDKIAYDASRVAGETP